MKFRLFDLATKNIGRNYPQIQESSPYWDAMIVEMLNKKLSDIDDLKKLNDYEIKHFYVTRGAKLTDMLSCVFFNPRHFLLLSDRLNQILKSNACGETYSLKTSLIHKDEFIENYNIFSIEPIEIKNILNFKKSTFILQKSWGTFIKEMSFNSYENFDEVNKQSIYSSEKLSPKQLFFNNSNLLKFDFFKIAELHESYFISYKLFEKLVKENLNGFSLASLEIDCFCIDNN